MGRVARPWKLACPVLLPLNGEAFDFVLKVCIRRVVRALNNFELLGAPVFGF